MRHLFMLCALLIAATASAEFTAQEKAQVLSQMVALDKAAQSMQLVTSHAQSTPADVELAISYISQLTVGWKGHLQGLLWLADQNGWDSGGYEQLLVTSQAETRQLGIARIQTPQYSAARTVLNQMAVSPATTTAKNLLDQAIAARAGFDGSLAYADPVPIMSLRDSAAPRERTGTAGPHGSYRMIGQSVNAWASKHAESWRALGKTLRWPDFRSRAVFTAGHLVIGAARIASSYGVGVGVESAAYAPHIDTMFAGGTTARGREFFRVLAMIEGLTNWTHTGPEEFDINGREMLRGYTYDLTSACQGIDALANPALYVSPEAASFGASLSLMVQWLCQEWGVMDDLVYQGGMGLKYFQVFPPPGPGGGGSVCPAGESCQPPDPPQIECGPGTHLDGLLCVADAMSCPAFVAQLNIAPNGITPVCVEQ